MSFYFAISQKPAKYALKTTNKIKKELQTDLKWFYKGIGAKQTLTNEWINRHINPAHLKRI